MNKGLSMIGGVGLGAALAYLYDPEMGNRRRAMIRDKAVKALNKTEEAIEASTKDLQHRVVGTVSELRSRVAEAGEEVSDELLEARVRAKIGMVSAHPGAIEVRVNNGRSDAERSDPGRGGRPGRRRGLLRSGGQRGGEPAGGPPNGRQCSQSTGRDAPHGSSSN
ncbi:MAG: hypothetical protein MPW15_24335 [Candidatus Manganitrophus sp.]|nr:hypothetical protein [Candidatus Manganitrophus sp.]